MRTTSACKVLAAAALLAACGDSGSSNTGTSGVPSVTDAAVAARPPVSENPFALWMAYDRNEEVVVALSAGETWLFDVRTDTWTETEASVDADRFGRLVYAPSFGSVVAVGVDGRAETFDVDAGSWTVAVPADESMLPGGGLVGVDEKSGDVVFVQWQPSVRAWVLDAAAGRWVEVEQSGAPTFDLNAGGPVMVYDEAAQAFVVLRYEADVGSTDEAWLFDARTGTWTAVAGVESLPFDYGPTGHEVAYVASTDRSVFVSRGVAAEYDAVADMWTLYADGKAITGAWDTVAEPENYLPAVVYDPVNERLLAFGGTAPQDPVSPGNDEMWAYDPVGHTWTQVLAPTQ